MWLEILRWAICIPFVLDVDPPEHFDPINPNPFDSLSVPNVSLAIRTRASLAAVCQKFQAFVGLPMPQFIVITNENLLAVSKMIQRADENARLRVRHLIFSMRPLQQTALAMLPIEQIVVSIRSLPNITITSLAGEHFGTGGYKISGAIIAALQTKRLQRISLLNGAGTVFAAAELQNLLTSARELRSLTITRQVAHELFHVHSVPLQSHPIAYVSIDHPTPIFFEHHTSPNTSPATFSNAQRVHMALPIPLDGLMRGPMVTHLSLRLNRIVSPPMTDLLSEILPKFFPNVRHLALSCTPTLASRIVGGQLPPHMARLSFLPQLPVGKDAAGFLGHLARSVHLALETVEFLDTYYSNLVRACVASDAALARALASHSFVILDRDGRCILSPESVSLTTSRPVVSDPLVSLLNPSPQ